MCKGAIAYGRKFDDAEKKTEIKKIEDLTEHEYLLINSTQSSNGTDCTNK